MPGAFKLDHLQPFAPLTFSNYSIFFTFILKRATDRLCSDALSMHCSTAPVNHSSRALVTLDKPATRKESRFISQIFTSLLTRDQIAQVDRYPKSCGKIFSSCKRKYFFLLMCMFRYQVYFFEIIFVLYLANMP